MKTILMYLCIVLVFVGCENTVIEKGVVQSRTENHYKKEFNYLDGTEEVKMRLEENQDMEVSFDIDLEEGELTFIIEDSSGNVVFETTESNIFEFNTGTEKYMLEIDASEAKGSFEVDWD